LLLHPRCEPLPFMHLGPFVTRCDGAVLTADDDCVWFSRDDGCSWQRARLFAEPAKYLCRGERALLLTRDGTLVLAFLNAREMAFRWDQTKGGPLPGCRLPVYVTRSTDDGETWQRPSKLQDGWCGALRTMIQLRSGRLVLGCHEAAANPGRNVCFSYVSDDDGLSWRKSNIIDLGEDSGCGEHGGALEPTLVQLKDGRLWMLIRTRSGRFYEAFSKDGGLTWVDIRPSKIGASSSPGQLKRLHSGRLVLFWNRADGLENGGGCGRLSVAFSEDDGRTWTGPVVVAYDPKQTAGEAATRGVTHAYVYERIPGELWVTTVHGALRMKLREDDFLPRRRSDQTYRARFVRAAKIRLDGKLDEPAWRRAEVERNFVFPWKQAAAPPTEFRALCDEQHLYFAFCAQDDDLVVRDQVEQEDDAVFEDRVEIYFSRDEQMQHYYCLEIDSRGRIFDYRGSYYRRFDTTWHWKGAEARAGALQRGYVVEGRIPLASFAALGFPPLRPGVKIRCGLFRAEFSFDRSPTAKALRPGIHTRGRVVEGPPIVQEWIAWVDPRTEEPDFHVPTSLGWLEIIN
ncbi:MAG: exo-alpha-sialidase, partial [Verrucomicrobiae bacterium]|nr:exo-alpha-sialidase [Verrucomicrobiae bacterium]